MSPQKSGPTDQPQQQPPTTQTVRSAADQDQAGRPVLLPPGVDVGLNGHTLSAPDKPASDVMVTRFEQTSAGEARPTITPELRGDLQAFAAQSAMAISGTWTQNVIVDAMWCINQTRNAYLHVKGGAWKKIFNGSDWAFTALTTLASQARQTGKPISFREEADGLVHEIYLY